MKNAIPLFVVAIATLLLTWFVLNWFGAEDDPERMTDEGRFVSSHSDPRIDRLPPQPRRQEQGTAKETDAPPPQELVEDGAKKGRVPHRAVPA